MADDLPWGTKRHRYVAKRDGEKYENCATREETAPSGPVAIVVCSFGRMSAWSLDTIWRRSPASLGFLERSWNSCGSFCRSISWREPSSNSTYL